MKKIYRSLVFIAIAILLVSALAGCGATDAVIKVGNDEIPSLYSVVGERKITGTYSGIRNGVRSVEKTYQSGAVTQEDIEDYWSSLREDHGFVVTMDTQESGTTARAQLANVSVDEGRIIVVDIDFDSAGSTVLTYTVGEGTLTIY